MTWRRPMGESAPGLPLEPHFFENLGRVFPQVRRTLLGIDPSAIQPDRAARCAIARAAVPHDGLHHAWFLKRFEWGQLFPIDGVCAGHRWSIRTQCGRIALEKL